MISTSLFIQGKQTLDELINSLEDTGMNKKEARQTANELLKMTEKYKKILLTNSLQDIEKKSKRTKKDSQKHKTS